MGFVLVRGRYCLFESGPRHKFLDVAHALRYMGFDCYLVFIYYRV